MRKLELRLALHPDAANNFNRKTEELLTEFTSRPQPVYRGQEGPLEPDIHIAANLGPEDIIGDIEVGHVDHFGNEIAKFFKQGPNHVGLFDESYKKLVRVAESIHNTRSFRNTVSITLLVDLIFEWLKDRYEGVTGPVMIEWVIGKCEELLKEVELWIPVYMLHVQSDLAIGKVTIRTITRAMIDDWRMEGLAKAKDDEERAATEQFIIRERGRLQGFAAAVSKVIAEPRRASEIAFEQAEQAVSLLRFYSPANFVPQLTSYCALLGRQHMDTYKSLTVQKGKIVYYQSGLVDRTEPSWPLSTHKIEELRMAGLDILSNLLLKEKRTEFQEELLAALVLYSKGSLAKTIADKLVYTLVGLESMFLRDDNEPIMDKMGERMAFLAGRSADERRAIVSNVKKTYALRSSFIHRGHSIGIDDVETLREFMLTAWACLQALIPYASNDESSKAQLFATLEAKKWA